MQCRRGLAIRGDHPPVQLRINVLGRAQVTGPAVELLEEPIVDDVLAEDLVGKGTDLVGDDGEPVGVESVAVDSVAAEDQACFVLVHTLEGMLDPLARVRPRSFRVWVVHAEHEAIDADGVAEGNLVGPR